MDLMQQVGRPLHYFLARFAVSEMVDVSRVGYRTNGVSSALQLHHLSSGAGQTDGIALPGVHQRRKLMEQAVTGS